MVEARQKVEELKNKVRRNTSTGNGGLRIVKIEENGQDRRGVTPNISDVGVDELKKGTVLLYEETSVAFVRGTVS